MKKEYDFSKMKKRLGKPLVIPDAGKIPVSLRIDYRDLEKIKTEATRLGIPYQTLINSVLHRFAEKELIDKTEIERLISMKSSKD